MTGVFVYAVRCNFAAPEREAAWNEWYSGPKLQQMLEKPLFLSVQRFAAVALDHRRKYLALWLVASPDAFVTPEYRADWGFFEWTRHITDWSRDLYASPLAADDPVFEIGPDEALYVASFDGLSVAAARQGRDAVTRRLAEVTWLEAAGLDRHAPVLGLRKIARAAPPSPLPDASGLCETVFVPISKRFQAAGPESGLSPS